ncbi:hypothetical protein M501DRAFT_1048963 [Patellaria atrata CBS 101060]|uniref:Uncharacterized protein n=1 Tax=Patellaria atrata CBS 101060 TaxID=1346257 RepID=A0A9P4SCW4_9PEZI|nr:hypothetical protein M501DRAFT_1048963 [Patellaria atrata CBS 101060]
MQENAITTRLPFELRPMTAPEINELALDVIHCSLDGSMKIEFDLRDGRYKELSKLVRCRAIRCALVMSNILTVKMDLILADFKGTVQYTSTKLTPGPAWKCTVDGFVTEKWKIGLLKWFIKRLVDERLSVRGFHFRARYVYTDWFKLCPPESIPKVDYTHRFRWTFLQEHIPKPEEETYDSFNAILKDQIKWYNRIPLQEIEEPRAIREENTLHLR